MDTNQQIQKFQEFLETYIEPLTLNLKKDRKFLLMNFDDLIKFDPDLADELLEQPEETTKAAELALEKFDMYGDVKDLKARFYNLPKHCQKSPWEIRSQDIGKLIALKGKICKMTGVIHFCTTASFECPSCGNIINVLQQDNEFRAPSKCGCGKKGKFRLMEKQMVDAIKITVQDDLQVENNKNRAAAREKYAILKNDLTSKEADMEIKAGRNVLVNGYLKFVQKKETVEFESMMEVNSVEYINVGWDNVVIKPEEEKKIIELSQQNDIIQRLANSVSDIRGNESIKTALLMQLAGAPNIYDTNGELASRGTIHILLCGDPGTGKTMLAKLFGRISPIYSFASAANASGRGLVALVNRDKEMDSWVLIPGVIPLANKGIAVIDEADKTSEDDYGDHNSAMNDMKVYVNKGTVKATLDTETSYLCTANPENREYTGYSDNFLQEIDMPKDFLDRFDIIFPLFIPKDEKFQQEAMSVMLDRHLDNNEKKIWEPEFDHEFIRKYISSCRKAFPKPKFDKALFNKVKQSLLLLMKPKEEGQRKISLRQLETITRFAYASARLRRRDVTEEDIDLAFKVKRDSFLSLGIIDEHGYNWNVEERIDEGKINAMKGVRAALKECFEKLGKIVPIEDVLMIAVAKGVERDEAEDILDKLKRGGEIFEPRRGVLSKLE